jgi:guanylate kinase
VRTAGKPVVVEAQSTSGGLFILSAPSGGGKTSLARAAVARLAALGVPAALSVSYTTRTPRSGEQHAAHYHFVTAAVFEDMARRGQFLEHAEVFGRRYGTGRAETERLRSQGVDVILDIDWQGARQVRAAVPDAVSAFVLPPSDAELERRLRGRGQDSEETIARRMADARAEMSHHDEYDYLIVNDVFERALEDLVAVFLARRLRMPLARQRHGALIRSLLHADGFGLGLDN